MVLILLASTRGTSNSSLDIKSALLTLVVSQHYPSGNERGFMEAKAARKRPRKRGSFAIVMVTDAKKSANARLGK
jgi:hypothetical protein